MSEHRYRIGYVIEPLPGEGLTKAEMEADERYCEGWGGTDKCVVFSIIESEGGRSIMPISRNADGSPLQPMEIYELVLLMARKLALEGGLDATRTEMCWLFFNAQLEVMGLKPQDLERAREIFADEGNNIIATMKMQ